MVGPICLFLSGGCATSYWHARGMDTVDMFTATCSIGGGARVRVGPIHAGLLGAGAGYGLDGGEFAGDNPYYAGVGEATIVHGEGCGLGRDDKGWETYGWVPLLTLPMDMRGSPRYWGQVEVQVGVYYVLRVGFNLFEFADFLLGWTGIDIMKDDDD